MPWEIPGKMGMAMVQIRIMRVLVDERLVPVAVRVRLPYRVAGQVPMPVMFVM